MYQYVIILLYVLLSKSKIIDIFLQFKKIFILINILPRLLYIFLILL